MFDSTKLASLETMMEWALFYASLGWRVFPVAWIMRVGNCSCYQGGECTSPGKHPIIKGGYKIGTTDKNQISTWWSKTPTANIAISTGLSNLFVLDIDKDHGGFESLKKIVDQYVELPETPTVSTGGGGLHYYFEKPEQGSSSSANRIAGIDVRSDGGLVVAPPSKHYSGGSYQWLTK